MAHCRKLSLKIGVKRLYSPDEAGIIWILILRGLISHALIGPIVFPYFHPLLICLPVFCETVEEDRNHKFSVRGFCFLMIFIDASLFFSLFLLRDRWVHRARSRFHLMKSCLPLDPLLWWARRSEDTRYVTKTDDKCVSRRVSHITHWHSERSH